MTQFDSFMSEWTQFAGSALNLITQVGVGYSAKNSPVYIAYYNLVDSAKNNDFFTVGGSIQLFLSQLIKFQSPDTNAKVKLVPKS